MPYRNRGHKARGRVTRSERNHGKEAQNGSRGEHPGRAPSETAERRPRDLHSGVDDQSASPRLLVASTSSRAPEPERAVEASDRSKSNKVLQTAEIRANRPMTLSVEDSDSSSSDTNYSDSSACYLAQPPSPYDGKPDQRVFDDWVFGVKNWASLRKLSRMEVMCSFPALITGDARWCYQMYVSPTLRTKKWKPKDVFEVLQKHCFPHDHKIRLYEQLKAVKQGNRKVSWYAEEIVFLASHLPPVSKEFLAIVFYTGLNANVRSLLAFDGIEPDNIDFETLVQHAENCGSRVQRAAYEAKRRNMRS